MAERTISVKCEVNEKNKTAIKSALSGALGIHFCWESDSFRGKDIVFGLMKYEIRVDEAPLSNGYTVNIRFKVTGWGIVIEVMLLLVTMGMYFLIPIGLVYLLGEIIMTFGIDIQAWPQNRKLIFLLVLIPTVFGISIFIGNLFFKRTSLSKGVLKKIDAMTKELNLES